MKQFKIIVKLFVLFWTLTSFWVPMAVSQTSSQPSLEALHNELRTVKQQAVDAINNGNADKLLETFSKRIIITAFNNDNVHGLDEAKKYYKRMMTGADKIIKEMSITAEADELSQFYAQNTIAVVSGTSMAHFQLKVGSPFDIPLRWTATMDRSSGKWKFAALHFSADPVNNPLALSMVSIWKWAAGILAILGLVLGYFLGRRKSRKVQD